MELLKEACYSVLVDTETDIPCQIQYAESSDLVDTEGKVVPGRPAYRFVISKPDVQIPGLPAPPPANLDPTFALLRSQKATGNKIDDNNGHNIRGLLSSGHTVSCRIQRIREPTFVRPSPRHPQGYYFVMMLGRFVANGCPVVVDSPFLSSVRKS